MGPNLGKSMKKVLPWYLAYRFYLNQIGLLSRPGFDFLCSHSYSERKKCKNVTGRASFA